MSDIKNYHSEEHSLSTVEFFDPSVHLRIDDTEIQIQDICDLTGDVFETIEISC